MADPASRKSATLNRLRSALRRKRESLADQFEFKIYMAVVFKDKVICIWLFVKLNLGIAYNRKLFKRDDIL